MERVQKWLAQAGVASRRKCEELIAEGRVTVNGRPVSLGAKVAPGDAVAVDGRPVVRQRKGVWVLNKPRGVISAVRDPQGRITVADLMAEIGMRLYPVGRLDYNTSGVLLVTNDGDLAYRLTHPRFGVEKKYVLKVRGVVSDVQLQAWRRGVVAADGTRYAPVVDVARIDESPSATWVHVTIKEGKNRQIRHMAEAVGMTLVKLKRVAFGNLTPDGLPPGAFRLVTPKELTALFALCGIEPEGDYLNFDPDYARAPWQRRLSREDAGRGSRTSARTASRPGGASGAAKRSRRSKGRR